MGGEINILLFPTNTNLYSYNHDAKYTQQAAVIFPPTVY